MNDSINAFGRQGTNKVYGSLLIIIAVGMFE
jgi:hypothetical protein